MLAVVTPVPVLVFVYARVCTCVYVCVHHVVFFVSPGVPHLCCTRLHLRVWVCGTCVCTLLQIAPAGTVVLFDANVWHRSGVNTTNTCRRALYSQYSATPVTFGPGRAAPLRFAVPCPPSDTPAPTAGAGSGSGPPLATGGGL